MIAFTRGRGWLIGAACALVAALVLGAAVGGWWLANMTLIASHEEVSDARPADSPVDADIGLLMPDVRGLDQAAAQQVLADSGIPAQSIKTYDAPSVMTPGVVVEQSPAFGSSDIATVELGIAVPATMPDLAGRTQEQAVEILSGFGTAVSISYGYARSAAAGTVISGSPATGEPLGQSASLVVATAGATLPLTQISPIAGRCGSRSNVAIDGKDYPTALSCQTRGDAAAETTWMLSKTVDRFTAVVGIADDSPSGTTAAYSVSLDGAVVAQGTASYGSSSVIDLDCSGAIQLTLRVGPATGEEVGVVFGNATVFGSDDGIARLANLR